MSTQTNQDSELQHSFGPGEVSFDFLPLSAASDAPLPTVPVTPVPTFDLGSETPLPPLSDLPPVLPPSTNGSANGKRRFWLDGETVLCGCPDCRAPMSVRIWLMTADCWRCGLSIDLTEAEEREINRLLNERPAPAPKPAPPAAKTVVTPPPKAPATPAPALKTPQPPPPPALRTPPLPAVQPGPVGRKPAPTPPVVPPPPPARKPAPSPPPVEAAPVAVTAPPVPPPVKKVTPPPPPPQRPVVRPQAGPRPQTRPAPPPEPETDWVKTIFDQTPAWVISGLVHLIALTLLAMFTIPEDEDEGPTILLSANMSNERVEGGDVNVLPPDLKAQFDMPLPEKVDLSNPDEVKSLIAANQDARELRVDADAPNMASVDLIKQQIQNATGIQQALAARDPRLRVEMVTQEGGTTMTEAAVARGLRWLANHQNPDGSWRLDNFDSVHGCNCGGRGHYHTKAPGTALALLPFLGAGQTHLTGKYKATVSRGLRWLLQHQKENGDLRHDERGNAGMYTQGQATIVLCEAFAMTGDEELRIPAQKAVDFVVKAQYNDGGWRYQPGTGRGNEKGDTSVVGWQLMALQSARAANLNVPDRTLLRASAYLDSCQSDGGAQYAYMAGHAPTSVMSAEALLCRMYLGWNKKQRPALSRGAQLLVRRSLPNKHVPNIYYWYYATQTMHHFGGEEWETWNLHMRDVLTSTQETSGHAAGSWAPRGDHAAAGGRIYMTSLAVCTLEVYYRHLPIFRQIKLD
jgi:hypothetical protein